MPKPTLVTDSTVTADATVSAGAWDPLHSDGTPPASLHAALDTGNGDFCAINCTNVNPDNNQDVAFTVGMTAPTLSANPYYQTLLVLKGLAIHAGADEDALTIPGQTQLDGWLDDGFFYRVNILVQDMVRGGYALRTTEIIRQFQEVEFPLLAWDNQVLTPALDLSDLRVTVTAETNDYTLNRWITVSRIELLVQSFNPTEYAPKLYLPRHCTDEVGNPVEITGSILKGGVLGYVPTGDKPDVAEVRAGGSMDLPSERTSEWTSIGSGEIKVVPQDLGMLYVPPTWPPLDDNYAVARFGWQTAYGVARSDWMPGAAAFTNRINLPKAPHMSATLVSDQVNIVARSLDNLMPPQFAGFSIPVEGWTAGNVQLPRVISGGTATWVDKVALGTTYAGAKSVRLTSTGVAAIDMEYPPVPVKASTTYHVTAGIYCNTVGGAALTVHVGFNWYNSAGTFISASTFAGSAISDNSSGTVTTSQASPASAAWAVPVVRINTVVASGDAIDVQWIAVQQTGTGISTTQPPGGYLWGNWLTGLTLDDMLNSLTNWRKETSGATLTDGSATNPFTGTVSTALQHTHSATVNTSILAIWDKKGPFFPEEWPGGTLTFGIRARASGSAGSSVGMRFLDAQGRLISETWNIVSTVPSGSHVTLSVTAEVPDGTNKLVMLLAVAETATVYWDSPWVNFGAAALIPPNALATLFPFSPGYYGSPFPSPASWLAVQRQLPGRDWTTIAILPASPTADSTFTDYVKPEGWTAKYRCITLGLQNGMLVEGTASAEVNITSAKADAEEFVLWDPSKDLHVAFDIVGGDQPALNYSLMSAMTAYSAIGQDRRIVTKDTSKGKVYQMTVDSIVEADLAIWEQMHVDRNVLLLARAAKSTVSAVILSGDPQVKVLNTTPGLFNLTINMEEIDVTPVW